MNADPELSLRSEDGAHVAVWHPQSETPEGLVWTEGNVDAKNPSRELTLKMCQIAPALSARVQGDDGELYPEALEAKPERGRGGSQWLTGSVLVLMATSLLALTVMLRYPRMLTMPGNQLPVLPAAGLGILFLLQFVSLIVTFSLGALAFMAERRLRWLVVVSVAIGLVPVVLLLGRT